MRSFLFLGFLIISSCAHQHEHTDKKALPYFHQHHGKGNCTVCEDDIEVSYGAVDLKDVPEEDKHHKNVQEYELYHGGMYYYFTSKEKLKSFKKLVD